MNKKGDSTGFGWIKIIVFICVAGFLFIILNQVYTEYITPAFNTLANDSIGVNGFTELNATSLQEESERWSYFWLSIPLIILLFAIIYLILNAIRAKRNELQ